MTREIESNLSPGVIAESDDQITVYRPLCMESPLTQLQAAQPIRARLRELRERFVQTREVVYNPDRSIPGRPTRIETYGDLVVLDGLNPHPLCRNKKLARDILTTKNRRKVIWENGIPLVNGSFLRRRTNGRLGKPGEDSNLIKAVSGTTRFEFPDPNILYFFATDVIAPSQDARRVLNTLDTSQVFHPDAIEKFIPVLSFIAELLVITDRRNFPVFMENIAAKIRGELGLAVAGAILEDLGYIFDEQPKQSNPYWKILDQTTRMLMEKRDPKWSYRHRERIIPPDLLAYAVMEYMSREEDPKGGFYAYLKAIYDGLIAHEEVPTADEITPLDWIAHRAQLEGKFEAGQILVVADMLGFSDLEFVLRIARLTHNIWTAITTLDDTIDQTPSRSGRPALYAQHGIPDGIRIPVFSMVQAIREMAKHKGMNDILLVEKISAMLASVYAGDIGNDRVSWNNPFGQFARNMKEIMQVTAWFPLYAAEVTGKYHEAADALAEFMENIGCLLLINNDFEDLEDGTHGAGNDIGRRVNTYMWAFNRCEEIPEDIRNEFRSLCDDPELRRKREMFEPLGEIEKQKIARALAIGRKYKAEVAQSLLPILRTYYEEAKGSLDNAFLVHLPDQDEDGYFYTVFQLSLQGMYAKFLDYAYELSS